MAINLVDIYNQALQAAGTRCNLTSPSENSVEADTCNLWYSSARDQVLASARWPEATRTVALAQLNEQDDSVWTTGEARSGLLYAYALPTDFLHPQFLTDFSYFTIQNYDSARNALMTNTVEALLVYTFAQDVIPLLGPELRMAIVMALASMICVPLTGKSSRAKQLRIEANGAILQARESAANMDNELFDYTPDWISARGYSGSTATRYFHPLGALLSA